MDKLWVNENVKLNWRFGLITLSYLILSNRFRKL